VEQQTLGDTCGFGDVAGGDVVEVTGGEVLDSGFEKFAPGQFSLHLPLRCGSWRLSSHFGVAGSHW
jgi:hypothetical protein